MLRVSVICLTLLASCANVTAVRVTSDNPTPEGLPLYGSKPILIVGAQGARVEIIPNLSERYALRMHAFLAKNHAVLTFRENGTLASVDANMDSTEFISFLEKLADKVPAIPARSGAIPTTGGVRIFDFVFNEDGTVGLREISAGALAVAGPAPASASSGSANGQGQVTGGGSFQPIGPDG